MKRMYFTIVIALVAAQLYAQTIYTVAGNGISGFSGDSGSATSSEIDHPAGVSLGNAGEYYIADYTNNRIRMVNAAGTIYTYAGNGIAGYSGDGGPATSAELRNPTAVKADSYGNIYIADAGNNCIRMVNSSGTITTVAGNGIAGFSGDGGAATSAELNNPQCVTIDVSGNVFIADAGNNRIRMVNTSGAITTGAGNGIAGYSGDGGAATSAELNNPNGMAIGSGYFYIADENNNRIRAVSTSTKIITTIAGNGIAGFSGDGGLATSAELNHPAGLKTGNAGVNVIFADMDNNRIREVIDSSGYIITLVGNGVSGYSGDGGPAIAAELNKPANVASAGAGSFYIADYGNNRIRQVIVTTGIDQLATGNDAIWVTPNPSNGVFTIKPSIFIRQLSVEVYNLFGEKVYSTTTNGNHLKADSPITIDLSAEPNGIYILKLTTQAGVISKRIILQK